jgi:hypothetical protein
MYGFGLRIPLHPHLVAPKGYSLKFVPINQIKKEQEEKERAKKAGSLDYNA